MTGGGRKQGERKRDTGAKRMLWLRKGDTNLYECICKNARFLRNLCQRYIQILKQDADNNIYYINDLIFFFILMPIQQTDSMETYTVEIEINII